MFPRIYKTDRNIRSGTLKTGSYPLSSYDSWQYGHLLTTRSLSPIRFPHLTQHHPSENNMLINRSVIQKMQLANIIIEYRPRPKIPKRSSIKVHTAPVTNNLFNVQRVLNFNFLEDSTKTL